MTLSPIQTVYNALTAYNCHPKWDYTRTKIQAKCPSHADRNPSLSVLKGRTSDGKEKAVITCFAGCQWENILQALNLTPKDCYQQKEQYETVTYVIKQQSDKE